ncbi:MAG TPA: prolyl oligopeptidase family serine peptidase [Allosphingosinicella sp.]|nr:prolyl oligopeptidase family serine peptidase [Allosphingosinicella sp.]
MKPIFAGALALLLTATAATAQTPPAPSPALINAPTRAAAEPHRETLFGQAIQDDWRWMERAERAADVEAFIRQSSTHTVARLAALPGRARLRARVAAGVQAGVRNSDLRQAGGLVFYRRTDAGAQLAKLVVRAADGTERILYDPEAGGRRGAAINSYSVSPAGRTVALHTAEGGAEAGSIRFIDVASGRTLDDRLDNIWGENRVTWLDERVMTYTILGPQPDPIQRQRVMLHRLGENVGGAGDTPLLGMDVPGTPTLTPQDWPGIFDAGPSDWLIGSVGGARADFRVLVARRADIAAGRPNWRVIASYEDRVQNAALSGDTLYLLTTRNNPNGEVLKLDLARPGAFAAATPALPAGELVLGGMAVTRDGLYVQGQRDGLSQIVYLPARGPARRLTLPLQGSAAAFNTSSDGRSITFGMEDWFTATRWYRAEGGVIASLGMDSASYGGLAGATQLREEAVSADGTRVPMAILLPAYAPRDGSLPILLEGYGAYGSNVAEPFYSRFYFGLVAEGGAVVFCGTRGGSERGRAWHEGGREANKPNAQADLIACAERLIQLRLTSSSRLTVMGTSAGGLLAPPAALRRPELFAGLIANVAILNPTRLAVAPNGPNQYAEMGDPNVEAGFNALMTQDSYQMLARANDTPDTLLLVGLNDRRVAPWMSAKYAARALDRFGSRRLVLIRTDPEAGHGIGSANEQLIETWTDAFTFVLAQARAPGFTGP